MVVMLSLCRIAVKHYWGENAAGIFALLSERFTDGGQRLPRALRTSTDRAWKTFELALAGDSWWDRMKSAVARKEEKLLAEQVRSFLDAHPLTELVAEPRVRELCLRDLHAARKAGHLAGDVDGRALAGNLRAKGPLHDPLTREKDDLDDVGEIAGFLVQQGYKQLGWLLGVEVEKGESLLAVAVRYYFRREVETDRELFQGLTFLKLEALSEAQARGFAELNDLLTTQSAWFDESLRLTRETAEAAAAARDAAEAGRDEVLRLRSEVRHAAGAQQAAVLDLKAEMQQALLQLGSQYESQFQKAYQPLIQALEQLQLQNRPLRSSDSVSVRDDRDRAKLEELLVRYRALTPAQRRGRPALINGLGQLEYAVNDFDAAQRSFAEAAGMAADPPARAEACFNAYRAGLECRPHRLDEALSALLQAAALDAERFAPFPLEDYDPLKILGAGGFGVTFLCRHRWSRGEVAIKSLSVEGLDRDVSTVFQEAQALEQLNHPSIVRLRDCKFADRACTRPFLVMDYFAGQTLEDYVAERGPLKFHELAPVAIQVAKALQAAHGANLLHRDVKPGNLLVRKDATGWQVRVIDFGLALSATALTHSGGSSARRGNSLHGSAIAGTLEYAAPEQMGKLPGVAIGPASDVYGFGKLCCYALFASPEPTFQDWTKLPRPAAELLGRCLNRQPQDRPANFGAVLRELEPLFVPEVVPVAKPAKSPPPLPGKAKQPTPAARAAKPQVPESVREVLAVKPTCCRVRFFLPATSSWLDRMAQPLLKVYLNGKFFGEGSPRQGFDLIFEVQPGNHTVEVVYWQNGERGRKSFALELQKLGVYEVRFNLAIALAQSLLGFNQADNLAKCTLDVLREPT